MSEQVSRRNEHPVSDSKHSTGSGEADKVAALPVIGITTHCDKEEGVDKLKDLYTRSLERAGGLPFLIPIPGPKMAAKLEAALKEDLEAGESMQRSGDLAFGAVEHLAPGTGATGAESPTLPVSGRAYVNAILAQLDGLILSGGLDPDPRFYGKDPIPDLGKIDPERDLLEIMLARYALETGVPVLGICRGLEIMNVATGGINYQDVKHCGDQVLKHVQKAPRRYPTHPVQVFSETLLWEVLQADRIRVNSFHHQGVKMTGGTVKISAEAPDGLPEAIEYPREGESSESTPFFLGVQWHPEGMGDQTGGFELFVRLVQEAYRSSKAESKF